MTLSIFKFMLTDREWIEVAPGISRRGCLAVVLAEDEAQARAILAADPDVDQRWIPFARVVRLETGAPRFIALSQ